MARTDRRTLLRSTAIATIGTGLAGCLGGENGNDIPDEIIVGCPTALSGPLAPLGEAELDGGILAAQHLENELDASIEIVSGDTAGDTGQAINQFEGMVLDDDVMVAYGGAASDTSIAMGQWANENQVPYSAHGSSDDITGPDCGPYMFSPYVTNRMQVAPTAPVMADHEDEWFILYSDYTWGHTAFDAYTEVLEEEGAEVIGSEGVPFPETEFTPYLNAAEDSGAGGIALILAATDQGFAMDQALTMDMIDDHTFMTHQTEEMAHWERDPEAIAGIDIGVVGWSPSLDIPDEWQNEMAEMSDLHIYIRHFLGYLSVDQLVRAAIRADSTEGDTIRDELRGHEIENDIIYDLQPTDEPIYWREEDHQLVQPTHVVSGRDIEDQEREPFALLYDIVETMDGSQNSPEPNPDCEM